MSDVTESIKMLKSEVSKATDKLDINNLEKKLESLKLTSEKSDFWSNNQNAQTVMKELTTLTARIKPWKNLKKSIQDLEELDDLDDESLTHEIEQQLNTAKEEFEKLKEHLKYSGKYDSNSAIIEIYAGAGGTDAQDWAQMLERMYLRWAEKNNTKTYIDQRSAGEVAGLKSVTIEFNAPFSYGKLKGEHGVHRLVRLSPFNADNLRQTSFAKVDVLPKIESPSEVEIDEKDVRIDVYRSGGHGGQSVNTTDSAVRVTHVPTNITVSIQNERSQLQNKETALTILRSKLAALKLEQHKEKLADIKGPNQSAEWGNQIRNYVLHPYKQVKDLRTGFESSDPEKILAGDIDPFVNAYLSSNLGKTDASQA